MIKAFKIFGLCLMVFLIIQTMRMYYSSNKIPAYKYLGLDGKFHGNKELPQTPLIFVYFSPECGFCEKAIIELLKLHRINKTVNYVFVTNHRSTKVIVDFVIANKLNELTNFILMDENDSFPIDFSLGMTYAIPTILVYNQSGEFVKELEDYQEIKRLKF